MTILSKIYLPVKNEELDLENTINALRKITNDKIIVVDNDSDDNSQKIANKIADETIVEKNKGKGNVIKKILSIQKKGLIFFTDSDNTYDVKDYESHKEIMIKDNIDMIIGKRNYDKKYLKRIERKFANKIFNLLFKILIGGKFSDICSGYRLLNTESFTNIEIKSKGFEIETELNCFAIINKLKILEVPIEYRERVESISKLKTFQDSSKIVLFLLKTAIKKKPLRLLFIIFIFILFINVF